MKKSLFWLIILPIVGVLWLYEMGMLLFVNEYQMSWFNQFLATFNSAIAMITFWFEEMDK